MAENFDWVESGDYPPSLVYPNNLIGAQTNFVRFTANKYQYGGIGEMLGCISLYHPSNISFSDNGSYSSLDMGPLGRELAGAMAGNQSIANIASNTINALTTNDKQLASLLGTKIVGDSLAALSAGAIESPSAIYKNVKGIAVNPNTTASFSNMAIRTYQFNFKLIPESQDDSYLIRKILNFLRSNMYPEQAANGYLLSYPATFNIEFYSADGKPNIYYPKIYQCYMTSFQTAFNASSHLHHEGGAPVEVDVSMSFQETKVLTKGEIDHLTSVVGG